MDLAKFAEWAVRSGPFDGTDLDGGDIQDKAVECGILAETTYDREKHGPSEYNVADGEQWFVFSDEFKAAIAAVDEPEHKGGMPFGGQSL